MRMVQTELSFAITLVLSGCMFALLFVGNYIFIDSLCVYVNYMNKPIGLGRMARLPLSALVGRYLWNFLAKQHQTPAILPASVVSL